MNIQTKPDTHSASKRIQDMLRNQIAVLPEGSPLEGGIARDFETKAYVLQLYAQLMIDV